MGKNQKELKVLNPSELCGDGSCGCGCGGLMETQEDLSQGKTQQVHPSSDEESLEITGNPVGKKGEK